MRKLFLRLILLSVILGGLVISPGPIARTSTALTECDSCDGCYWDYQDCIALCPPMGWPGHFSCIAGCRDDMNYCSATCDPFCNPPN
jgi:hypothetical protein